MSISSLYIHANIVNGHGVGSHVIAYEIVSPSSSVAFTENTVVPILALVDILVAPDITNANNFPFTLFYMYLSSYDRLKINNT